MNKVREMHVHHYIVGIYVFTIFAIFPLVFHDYYYDMPTVKYQFYYISSLLFFLLIVIYALMSLYRKKEQTLTLKNRFFFALKWNITEKCLLFFLFAVLISTILSPYKFEAFWGNEGRYSGFFLILIYGIAFFLVSRLLVFKAWYIDAFIITGILVCLFGITDYFDLDLLGFKVNIVPNQRGMFTSTLGNVNFYTAYVAMVMGVVVTLFTTATGFKMWLYYLAMSITFAALITGGSDNTLLSVATLFAFLPFYLFKTKKGVYRYLISVSTLFTIMQVILVINIKMKGQVMVLQTVLLSIANMTLFPYIVMTLWIIALFCLVISKKSKCAEYGIWLRGLWFMLILIAVFAVLWVIWDINMGTHNRDYGMIGQYFLINDEWGTNRGYIWRIAIESYQNFPFLQKIFGHGMDTFGILTKHNYFTEMLFKYGECFDSVHNEYLQYFITIGPVGLVAYLMLLINAVIRMSQKAIENPYIMAILFSVLCYCAQAFVNISLPNTAPIMWTLLMVGIAGCRDLNKKR